MDKNMERKPALSDEDLDQVVGGARRTVYNDNASYVNIRYDASLNSTVAMRVYNGDSVCITGFKKFAEGYTWYEVISPCEGWIVGSFIGY